VRIGVVGAGLMGLAVADRLAELGHSVTVYERDSQPGGLATWQDFGPFVWDRFYHVILPSDRHLIALIRRIGLEDQLNWAPTGTGYYVDRTFYSLSTGADFLRFPPLNLWNKMRLAATILYCSRIEDWRRLEHVTVEEWLRRTSGDSTFEKFWQPLLLAKLGEHYRRVSAVFIWSYIKRLFSARDATAAREHLGYVTGGYRTVFQRLLSRLAAAEARVELDVAVSAVRPAGAAGIVIATSRGTERFDKVVFTGPANVMRQAVDPALVNVPPARGEVEYLGVVCGALITRRPIVPYYVLNIADERIPFTGIIGMSNLVAGGNTAGLHLTYLPKYVLSDDPLLRAPEEALKAMFERGLAEMFPRLAEAGVERLATHRAFKVQPLQVLGYSSLVQTPETRHPDFYVLNTAQFVSNTLNNNEVARAVERFFADFGHCFPRCERPAARERLQVGASA
jgi:protoporphyrinogen oxidase